MKVRIVVDETPSGVDPAFGYASEEVKEFADDKELRSYVQPIEELGRLIDVVPLDKRPNSNVPVVDELPF